MTEFAAHVEDFCTRLFEDIRKLTADTCGVTREGYTRRGAIGISVGR